MADCHARTKRSSCAALEIAPRPNGRPTSTGRARPTRSCARRSRRCCDAHRKLGSFLESPDPPSAVTDRLAAIAEGPGTVIGPYKLMEQIGEGGMGVVYVAEQTQPVRRKVALKIIKPGMDTKQVIARFEAERQALAMMDHPNIAKVLDAGATESGRPYFVMELVRGIPITEYCDRERLSIRRAAGAVRPGLPGRAARPPEGDHPPRPEALEHPGDGHRRRAGAQGHRLRRGQGHRQRRSPSGRSTPPSTSSSARRCT